MAVVRHVVLLVGGVVLLAVLLPTHHSLRVLPRAQNHALDVLQELEGLVLAEEVKVQTAGDNLETHTLRMSAVLNDHLLQPQEGSFVFNLFKRIHGIYVLTDLNNSFPCEICAIAIAVRTDTCTDFFKCYTCFTLFVNTPWQILTTTENPFSISFRISNSIIIRRL